MNEMRLGAFVTLFFLKSFAVGKVLDVGYFWQVTDFHYDTNYSEHGDPGFYCHVSTREALNNLSRYGDYRCDSSWLLVKSAVDAMQKYGPNPDFILWTGDSIPHINETLYDRSKVFTVIQNVTDALLSAFPGVKILPSFGNHDVFPSGQMSDSDADYYRGILEVSHWNKALQPEAYSTFLKGGYYSFDANPYLKIINLNTALLYTMNNLTTSLADPSGQLAWLVDQLKFAQNAKQKVYIAAHIPPGVFELNTAYKWFHGQYSKQYMDIMEEYAHVITAHFYGHEHTDAIRLHVNEHKEVPMFLSPAVTPWNHVNNPSIRLYKYHKLSGRLLDYNQYYLNLSAAITSGSADWSLEYTFTSAYDVPDLRAKSVRDAVTKIFSPGPSVYLTRYLTYNSVSARSDACNETCLMSHKCATLFLRYEDVISCMNGNKKLPPAHHSKDSHHRLKKKHNIPDWVVWMLIAFSIGFCILSIVTLIMCCRQRLPYLVYGRGRARLLSGMADEPEKHEKKNIS